MSHSNFRSAAGWSAAVLVTALTVASGFRWSWWSTLNSDSAASPWGWIERIGWVAAIVSLPATVVLGYLAVRQSKNPSGGATPPDRAWQLIPVEDLLPGHVAVHGSGRLPPYIPRGHDSLLRSRLSEVDTAGGRGIFVMIGESATGKSRSAYEAVKAVLPHWQVLIAENTAAIRESAPLLTDPTVLWVDETPSTRFLAPDGLSLPDILRFSIPRPNTVPAIILIQLWPETYHRLISPLSSRDSGDPSRNAREILLLASDQRIEVSDRFTPRELSLAAETVAKTNDPGLHAALADRRLGFTQHLAGAPQLLQQWNSVADPYGVAIITSAVDIWRLGVRALPTAETLFAAVPGYLKEELRAEAPQGWFDAALRHVTRPLSGNVRALRPNAGPGMGNVAGYEVSDYLLQHITSARHASPVPATTWRAIVAQADNPEDLAALASSADSRMFYVTAIPLYRRLAESGETTAALRLTQLLVQAAASDEEIVSAFTSLRETGLLYAGTLTVRGVSHRMVLDRLRREGRIKLAECIRQEWLSGEGGDRRNGDGAKPLSRHRHEGHRIVDLVHSLVTQGRITDAASVLRDYPFGRHFRDFTLFDELIGQHRYDDAILLAQASLSSADFDQCARSDVVGTLAGLFARLGRLRELRQLAESSHGHNAKHVFFAELERRGRSNDLEALAEKGEGAPIALVARRMLQQNRPDDARHLVECNLAATAAWVPHLFPAETAGNILVRAIDAGIVEAAAPYIFLVHRYGDKRMAQQLATQGRPLPDEWE